MTDSKTAEKRLTGEVVAAILLEMGFPVISGPHGFDLPCVRGNATTKARLERGGGIASRVYCWHITEHDGTATPSVCTARELRRLLREWRAGPKPPGAKYARLHRNRFGEHYIWV